MPELPEVEVLKRSLARPLTGARFGGGRVWKRALREPVPPGLPGRLRGRKIRELRRRAKYLLLDLDNGYTLVVHLGMSGRLGLFASEVPRHPHDHVVLDLEAGRQLRFRDPRRFGLVLYLPTASLEKDRHFRHLGVEPLEGELSGATLAAAAQGRRGPVKNFLMDARVVVGVGNIYACEALFEAGVHPRRSVARLARWDSLADAVVHTLERAIAAGGTTLNDFADGDGNAGYFQVDLAAYGRAGRPCVRCEKTIRRVLQAQRSTYYCPGCQR